VYAGYSSIISHLIPIYLPFPFLLSHWRFCIVYCKKHYRKPKMLSRCGRHALRLVPRTGSSGRAIAISTQVRPAAPLGVSRSIAQIRSVSSSSGDGQQHVCAHLSQSLLDEWTKLCRGGRNLMLTSLSAVALRAPRGGGPHNLQYPSEG
jgi:hypothetical protein